MTKQILNVNIVQVIEDYVRIITKLEDVINQHNIIFFMVIRFF